MFPKYESIEVNIQQIKI